MKEKNIEILDILTEDADLEDVFLKLTKKNNSEVYFLKKNILNMNYLFKFLNYTGNDLEQSAFKKS